MAEKIIMPQGGQDIKEGRVLRWHKAEGDPVQKDEVRKDLVYGQSVGVRGTPHFFVGRVEGDKLVDVKALSGAQPFPSFQNLIEAFLQ